MKKGLTAIILSMVLLLSWVIPASANGFGGGAGGGTIWATSFFYKIGEGTVTAQLIAGKSGQIGTVTVWEDSGNINVQYDTNSTWNIAKTSLDVGRGSTTVKAESKIAHDKNGNYTPDKFDFIYQPGLAFDTYTYSISESSLGSGNWLCIAAYANATSGAATSIAWGDVVPVGQWKLPNTAIDMQLLTVPGDGVHYTKVNLTGIGEGFSISNGDYNGWCGDEFDQMANELHHTKVYSSLNLYGAPAVIKNLKWDKINYIINHYNPVGPDDEDARIATIVNVQYAIWYFTNGDKDNQTAESQAMVNDAIANGSGFSAGPGQISAVILDPAPANDDQQPPQLWPGQLMFIELFAPTRCYTEVTCRHDCNPGWSPCSNWEPQKGSTCNWNPGSFDSHYQSSNHGFHFTSNPKCSPKQNLDNFKKLCGSRH